MKPSPLFTFSRIHPRFFSAILSPPPPPHRRRLHAAVASSAPDTLRYLESFRGLIDSLSKNPRNYKALTALDSFLAQTHIFTPAISVISIDFLSQIKKLQRAKALVLNLKRQGQVSDHFSYGLVLDFLVKDGNFDAVEMVWAEICGPGIRICASDYVMHVSKYGSADEVKRVCRRVLMGGSGRVVWERQSLVSLIGALCNVNECGLAEAVCVEMLNRGIPVDDLSYFVIFQCFCRNGAVIEADNILRKLWESNFLFDICIYGNFLHALCKSDKLREAKKLFCKLIKNDNGGLEVSKKVVKGGRRAIFQMSCEVPEIMAYEAYFRSLCSAGRINEAENLLKEMMKKRNVIEVCVYGSFITALFLAGRAEDALKFFEVESKKKRTITREDMSRYVIKGLCGDGRVDEALELLRDINRGSKMTTYFSTSLNHILESYWKEGRVDEAERLFYGLQCGSSFVVYDVSNHYKTMINGYCVQGDVSKALGLVNEMVSRKMSVKPTLYSMVIRGLCDCGRLDEGLRCFDAMIGNGNAVSATSWKELLHPLL
ncbi:unnamed protein product [Cuscuta campestris]|uniref:Pentacotripeptide-repeat region of PRORP domain-containing protein n=1 Tax=Cuscuta campestris TaxID=132261 RepID=A0A484K0A9_9ASTE|nr:unnamed protein product [Cuscuta campestris]